MLADRSCRHRQCRWRRLLRHHFAPHPGVAPAGFADHHRGDHRLRGLRGHDAPLALREGWLGCPPFPRHIHPHGGAAPRSPDGTDPGFPAGRRRMSHSGQKRWVLFSADQGATTSPAAPRTGRCGHMGGVPTCVAHEARRLMTEGRFFANRQQRSSELGERKVSGHAARYSQSESCRLTGARSFQGHVECNRLSSWDQHVLMKLPRSLQSLTIRRLVCAPARPDLKRRDRARSSWRDRGGWRRRPESRPERRTRAMTERGRENESEATRIPSR